MAILRATCLLLCAPLVAAAGDFTFTVNGETFTYSDAQRTFSGLILVPPGPGPFPAIVFGHGSGRATRDEARGLASRLVAAGFAVLRYDKRGVRIGRLRRLHVRRPRLPRQLHGLITVPSRRRVVPQE